MMDDIFLLDTNVVSNSSKSSPAVAVTDWMATQKCIAIPFPVILELETGIADVTIVNPGKAAILRSWADELLGTDFVMPLPDAKVAALLGAMYCCRSLTMHWLVDAYHGRKKPGQDLFIAALAIVHDMPIATMDHGDFMQINQFFELPGVYNPNIGFWAIPRQRKVCEARLRTANHTPPTFKRQADIAREISLRGSMERWAPQFD